jgi:hypothetical protein
MTSNIASHRSEDGMVYEVLDGKVLKEGESINILWPDQFKESRKVMIVSQIVPQGTVEKAHVRMDIHGINVPVALIHLVSLGAIVSRKPLW